MSNQKGIEVLNGLMEIDPYFTRVGLEKDFHLILTIYAEIFPGLVMEIGGARELSGIGQANPDTDYGTLATKVFNQLSEIEEYARETGKEQQFLKLLKIFSSPFQYLAPIAGEKIQAYLKAEQKRKYASAGTATVTRPPKLQIGAVQQKACPDCPEVEQPGIRKPLRTAVGTGKVLTYPERIEKARQKALSQSD